MLRLLLLPIVRIRLLLAASALAGGSAVAQVPLLPDEFQRVDVIAIERDGRDLYSFDAVTGARSSVQLEIGEDVLFQRARGRVGIVLTDRRALAVTSGFGWQEERYGLHESTPDTALVDEQVALLVTDRRALGFVARGAWVEEALFTHESVAALRVGSAAAVVATSKRALGLASDRTGFVPTELQIKERLESVKAEGTLVTLRTDRRILVFSAPRAFWSEQQRKINPD
jgi:hypothetical protein